MTRSERLAHERHEARMCVPPELVCVFDRVVKSLAPSKRMTLVEAFEQWCHDHGGDVARYQAEDALRGARELDRAQRREARERALERFVVELADDGDPMDREEDPANFVLDLWLIEEAA